MNFIIRDVIRHTVFELPKHTDGILVVDTAEHIATLIAFEHVKRL